MGSAIGSVLPEAVAIAISPIPIIAIILMLASSRAAADGLSYLFGWLLGLAVVGTLVLVLADPAGATEDDGGPATWVGWVVLILGVLVVLLGIRQWMNRPREGDEPDMPGWMKAIDGFSSIQSFGMGFLLSALNPKNVTLTLAAAAAIATAGLATGESFVVLAIFVVVGTLGLLIPLLIYGFAGEKAADILGELQEWMSAHNAVIMTVLLIVIGTKLIGNGLGVVSG